MQFPWGMRKLLKSFVKPVLILHANSSELWFLLRKRRNGSNGVAGNRDEGCEKDLTRRRRGDRVDGEVIRMLVFEVYGFEVDADSGGVA